MFVVRTDTHFLVWVDLPGENTFHVLTIQPTIGWVEDINAATLFVFRDDAERKLGAFPPGTVRVAKVTRIEVAP